MELEQACPIEKYTSSQTTASRAKLLAHTSKIKEKAIELGFHKVGIAAVKSFDISEAQRLEAWLALGYNADMEWMKNAKRKDIKLVMPQARSLICLALNYYTPHQHSENKEYAKISRYAWGRDYHKVMDKKLKFFSGWLQTFGKNFGEDIKTRYYADTGPIQDKVWAQTAGIGWIAKNGNLITREYGSWVFLGEIVTNLELTADNPHTQHCGSCTRCIEACPTSAIIQPFVVDANRCIAYHTIENRRPDLPENIKANLNGWVAGCDICQDVCPWNNRFAQTTDVEDFQPYANNISPSFLELSSITNETWDQRFRASALRRIKPEMLRRNARANLERLSIESS
ncbi:MAG: tRNA epoxyqueuosine(34) reductase QueG [Cyanobacteria bacterium P01_A01_bin.45]